MEQLVPRIDFSTAADGRRLAARVWKSGEDRGSRSEKEALAPRLVFLHGITSHGGWYNRSCRHLARAGFEVHFLDRRGSGLNSLDPGDVDRYETWLSDVEVYLENIGSRQPVVLAGISWGGKLAAAVARHRPDLLKGLALICPGLYSYQQPGFLSRLILSGPMLPRMKRRRVTIPLTDPRLFTDTPPWVSYVAEDPLSLREVTIRFVREDLKLTRYAREAMSFPTLDVLMVLSGRDRIVDNAQTRAYFARVTARSTQLIECPTAAHTLEFEPDPRQYLADLTSWMNEVSGL